MTGLGTVGRGYAIRAIAAAAVSAGIASLVVQRRRRPAPALRPVAGTGRPQRGSPIIDQRPAPAIAAAPEAAASPRSGQLVPDYERYPRALWLTIYAAALAGPFLLVAATAPSPPRPFVFELGSALGISALSLLALQLVLPARLRVFAPLGADVAVRLHRRLADVLVSVVAAHIAIVMIADPNRLALLTFFGAPWRAQAAVGSVVAIAAIASTSILRRRLHLSYAGWRGIHLVLAVAALLLAIIHTIGVGRYLASGVPAVALGTLALTGFGAAVALRVPRLRRRSVRPYTLERVIREQGGATTLALKADRHAGQPFAPGQFAWLKLPGIRSNLEEHPFSYSSSAFAPDRPSFTIQPYGGFSKEVASFEPGTRLLVDGPHGSFRLQPDGSGIALIAGGIGITPSMSVLRTAADQRDPRPMVLVYSVKSPDRIVFKDELVALEQRLRLSTLFVVSTPPPDWPGLKGRITSEVLDLALPDDLRGWQFLLCGPPPFVDASLDALLRLGIPAERVHAERFVGV